jgi:hypothetical protein
MRRLVLAGASVFLLQTSLSKAENSFSELLAARSRASFEHSLAQLNSREEQRISCEWEVRSLQPPCHCYGLNGFNDHELDKMCAANAQRQVDLKALRFKLHKCRKSKTCMSSVLRQVELLEYQSEARELRQKEFFAF